MCYAICLTACFQCCWSLCTVAALKGAPSNTNANGSISTVAGSVAPARGCSPSHGEPHGGAGVVLNDVRGLVANRNRALELYPLVQDKLDCIFNQADFEQKTSHQYPYLLEWSLITILRACIHLFDIPAVSFVSFISSTHDVSFLLSTIFPISLPLSVARPVSRFPETVKPASRFIC